MKERPDFFSRAVLAATYWRDDRLHKTARDAARRRFRYALNRIRGKDGSKPNAVDRLRLHMAAVEVADLALKIARRRLP